MIVAVVVFKSPVDFVPPIIFRRLKGLFDLTSGGSRQRRERRALPLKKKKKKKKREREKKKKKKKKKKKHVDLVHDELKRDPYEDAKVEVRRRTLSRELTESQRVQERSWAFVGADFLQLYPVLLRAHSLQ